MKTKRGCGAMPWLAGAISLFFMLRPWIALAADETKQMSLKLNAGETYVIDHVSQGATPGVKVIENAHALVVHNEEPGKVVLLGAEAGRWDVKVKLANGDDVTYDVLVKAAADHLDISNPADAPPAITGTGAKTGSAAPPVAAKLDEGAGPVDGSSVKRSGDSAWSAPTPKKPETERVTVAEAGASPAPPATASEAEAPAPSQTRSEVGAATIPVQAMQQPFKEMPPQGRYTNDPSITETGGDYPSVSVHGGTHYLPEDGVSLMTGSSRIIDFPQRVRRVSVADTGVADIQVINPYQINLIGHKPGFTTLAVWDSQGHYDERQVRIDPNGKQQVMLNTIVAELDRQNLENQGINLSFGLTGLGLSFVGLPGAVATPFSAQQSSSSTPGTSGNMLSPAGTLTGLLLSQNLTYGLASSGSGVVNQSLFQYLEQHNLAKILAQPHLLANSGEQAKFMSGGEIPIIIAQALNTSIVFKQFGTMVEFVPTVTGRNDIELLVKPEVSEPDPAHGVNLFGFSVPAFVTRKAETMVRLKDNQTLIIAGLISHEKKTQVQKVPYLGDIPYMGALFRNTTYSNTESDLVMSVTPQIVRPLPDGGQVYNPYETPEMTTQQLETRRLAQPDASRPRF